MRLLPLLAACGTPSAAPDAAVRAPYAHAAALLPPLPTEAAAFGAVIASSGDGATIAVGEVGAVLGGQPPVGEVFVFPRDGAAFADALEPAPEHGAPGDKFGASIALDATGATLAVGACGQASGSADETDRSMPHAGAIYVFGRTKNAFAQVAFLKTAQPHASDNLCSLAIAGDGNTIAAAAVAENSAAGAVYIFATDGVTWTQRARLVAPGALAADRFGASLALSADGATLVAGLPGRGDALIYDRSGDAWTLRATLSGDAGFGEALALSGLATTLVVGAPQAGSAEIFALAGGDPVRVAQAGGSFGAAVAVSRDGARVAIAGPGTAGRVLGADGTPVDAPAFTGSVALSSDGATLAVGTIADHSGTGEAHVYY